MLQQSAANALAARFRGYADLGHVAHVMTKARAQQKSLQVAAGLVAQYPGVVRVKDAAAGKTYNVVQEPQ